MTQRYLQVPPPPTVFDDPTHWADGPFAAFDVETTGKDPETAHIVQASFLVVAPEGDELLARHTTLVRLPKGVECDPDAVAAHGITPERIAAEGEGREMALYGLYTMFQHAARRNWPVVIYNTPYDWAVVRQEWKRIGLQHEPGWRGLPDVHFLDPLVLDRHLDKYRKGGRRLAQVAAHYGVPLGDDAHDAEADCLAAVGVARAIIAAHPHLRTFTLGQLQERQADMDRIWLEDINAYFRRQGRAPLRRRSGWPA